MDEPKLRMCEKKKNLRKRTISKLISKYNLRKNFNKITLHVQIMATT